MTGTSRYNPRFMPHKYIVSDPWMSSILNHPAYQVKIDDDALVENVLQQLCLIPEKKIFASAKIPTRRLDYCNYLLKNQFCLADTNVTFDKEIRGESYQSNCHIRHTCKQDIYRVMELAERSFLLSRFHLDPFFSKNIAIRIKREWVSNFYSGKRGDALIVAEIDEKIVGFLLILFTQEDVTVDLVAADESYRRRGIARSLLMFIEVHFTGFQRIIAGTQIANIVSQRFYESLGFQVCDTRYVFHYHHQLE